MQRGDEVVALGYQMLGERLGARGGDQRLDARGGVRRDLAEIVGPRDGGVAHRAGFGDTVDHAEFVQACGANWFSFEQDFGRKLAGQRLREEP